jgi:hypothetical protein
LGEVLALRSDARSLAVRETQHVLRWIGLSVGNQTAWVAAWEMYGRAEGLLRYDSFPHQLQRLGTRRDAKSTRRLGASLAALARHGPRASEAREGSCMWMWIFGDDDHFARRRMGIPQDASFAQYICHEAAQLKACIEEAESRSS